MSSTQSLRRPRQSGSICKNLQHLGFILLTLACIPLSTSFLVLNYICASVLSRNLVRRQPRKIKSRSLFKTVLLTGINTPQGLRLARAFHEDGHRVIGADYEPEGVPIPVRLSKALSKFHRLSSDSGETRALNYIKSLAQIIKQGRVDIWINCTSTSDPGLEGQARALIEKTTKCRCFALTMDDAVNFATRDTFLTMVKDMGLPVPEIYQVASRDEVHNVLHKSRGRRKYLLYSPGHPAVTVSSVRTLLPRRSLSQTYNALSLVPINKASSWRLEQITDDLPRYSTFSVIVEGLVTAFAASVVTQAGYYEAANPESALTKSMLHYMQTFAAKQGPDFNTHLGVDFCVEEQVTDRGIVQNILPVEIAVQSQTAMLLFQGMKGSDELCQAYLSSTSTRTKNDDGIQSEFSFNKESLDSEVVMPSRNTSGVYSFGQDLLRLGYAPLIRLLTLHSTFVDVFNHWMLLLCHLVYWQDDAYDFQDPVPFWWSYQVYLPLRLLMSIISGTIPEAAPFSNGVVGVATNSETTEKKALT
ncbi:catechol O-methyltransferase, variant [Exophiala viscosa]|uniref:Catechol O-methyltransferase, variant n=1 Tax=Exophiala viscosa TaxID=2486360 RepID=A0AAN6DV49_9EURO|nr:catechol O-methyltransferase, variant [Exophiala viscosa]KAI1625731.1 catechol O-methyltransferase, variant [Exophiala viscosa]